LISKTAGVGGIDAESLKYYSVYYLLVCWDEHSLCRIVENGEPYVDFFNNGMTCVILLYKLCPHTRSIVFVSSSMYDVIKRLALYKFSEECPCMFIWYIEVVRQICLVMFYSTFGTAYLYGATTGMETNWHQDSKVCSQPHSVFHSIYVWHLLPHFAHFSFLQMETVDSSKTMGPLCWATWHHITEDCNLNIHCHENIKFHQVQLIVWTFA